jgi:hypothetical protein
MPREDQVRSFTRAIAEKAKLEGAKPHVSESTANALLIDFDGFFKSMTELGARPISEALGYLPLSHVQAGRAQSYIQLFDSAMWFPLEMTEPHFGVARSVWWWLALKSAVIAAVDDGTGAQEWGAFFAADLHEHMCATHPALEGTRVRLTLSRRLVARTDRTTRTVYISAVTRSYLLHINVALSNYAEMVVEDGEELSRLDTFDFFEFVLAHSLPLHRPIALASTVVRPHRQSAFQFAQRITQIQLAFMAAHEYGHLTNDFDSPEDFGAEELGCDDFAFRTLDELQTPPWMQFLATRWLLEVLAFDRVLAEALAVETDGWGSQVDWLQAELRDRRPIERFPERISDMISAYENVGSLFLLDLKGWLHQLGPDFIRARLGSAERRDPILDGAEFSSKVQSHLGDVPDHMLLSVAQVVEMMRENGNSDASD